MLINFNDISWLCKTISRTIGCSLLVTLALLAAACGADPATDSGSVQTAAQGNVATVTIDTTTVEPILAPPATPTTPPTTNESTEPATAPTSPDPSVSAEQETESTAEQPAEVGTSCAAEPDLDFAGYPAFGTLRELMGCAVAEPLYEAVAINEFGEGPEFDRFMLWTSADQLIYVLRPDGSWEAHLDTWNEDMPELTCNPFDVDISSPPLPRRGFGKLWCEIRNLAEMMGTIEREERLCQHAVLQQFEGGQLLACFEDATYHYFRIMNDQSWESIFIQ